MRVPEQAIDPLDSVLVRGALGDGPSERGQREPTTPQRCERGREYQP
jgi:hypothetical protein